MIRRGLWRSTAGMALPEFALILPLFAGVTIAGIEMANYVLANAKVQRMATMTADLVAQSGTGNIGVTEAQIYDLFHAIDVTSQPFDLRGHGRVVITAVKGVDPNPADALTVVQNRILWQRFDGNYVTARPILGCRESTNLATLPDGRTLGLNELLFHAQVSYEYQPIFFRQFGTMLNLPQDFTRQAVFRGRSLDFQTPTPNNNFPPKQDCDTRDGQPG